MSFQLIERPHKHSFSLNPIRYVFTLSNPATPGCAMEIELYCIDIDSAVLPGTLVTRQLLTPNPDGSVNFYCEDFLNSQLDWQLPPLKSVGGVYPVVAVTKQIKKFYIRYRQITKANPAPPYISEEAHIRIVLKGGVAKEKFDRNNFFINYLPGYKPFLTWLPDKHFVGLEETRYLSYFHDDDTTPDLFLKARVVGIDGQELTVTKDFPPLADSLLFHLPAGIKQLDFGGGLAAIIPWYYDVSVEDADGNVLANPYRLYADYRNVYNVFSFIYHNSISGIDTLRIRGDYDEELSITSTEIQQATGGDYSQELLPTENAIINISAYEVYKGDAGWQNTKRMQDALKDLLRSDGVYRPLFGKWLRVVNLQRTQAMGSKEDTIWSFPLQWRYTFDNTQYTPLTLDLGIGFNDEPPGDVYGTCTAPGNLIITEIGPQDGGKLYRFEWDAVADAESYWLEYTGPNGIVITSATLIDTFVEIVLFQEGDYTWQVRTKCGTNDYSGFAPGQPFTLSNAAPVCASPNPLSVILIALNGNVATIKFSWPAVAGVFGYIVEYREVGASIWQNHQTFPPTTEAIHDLDKDRQYECRVRSICNFVDFGPLVYGPTFIPSNMVGTCNPPTNLVATALVDTPFGQYVRLSWTNAAATSSYMVQWREAGTTVWSTLDLVNTSPLERFLPNNRTWEWRVRSNCTGGGFSNFVNGVNFNT